MATKSLCNVCNQHPKKPGQGQRFCSDECQRAAKAGWKQPSKEAVRNRATQRRRARGMKERPPTWDAQGRRRCPRCDSYFDLSDIKGGYCLTCLPLKRRDGALRLKYGITRERYEQILLEQDNCCAICLRKFTKDRVPQVDHDHSCCPGEKTCGECIRGVLCRRCNHVLLGAANDDPQLLRRAADHVERIQPTRANIR